MCQEAPYSLGGGSTPTSTFLAEAGACGYFHWVGVIVQKKDPLGGEVEMAGSGLAVMSVAQTDVQKIDPTDCRIVA